MSEESTSQRSQVKSRDVSTLSDIHGLAPKVSVRTRLPPWGFGSQSQPEEEVGQGGDDETSGLMDILSNEPLEKENQNEMGMGEQAHTCT